ncbi:hypothetical protein [Tumebacillus permanentifrigoris]|uniref:Uncharacterized protein n=1 Tax=Tumebacillus permanentifrigoris TaxID=378543 RepID=A0A316D465_9BACL|nr:hypothetical protein [Tumebacillus permanentifrigoris]PWK07027.1 hypothetical protein C7459_118101 [Tumebacillus permanentifrigoris]
MNKKLFIIPTAMLLVSLGSTGAHASEASLGILKAKDMYVTEAKGLDTSYLPLPEDQGKQVKNLNVVVDNTFKDKAHTLNGRVTESSGDTHSTLIPDPDPTSSPYLNTNVTWSGGHQLEWTVSNGKFLFFQRPDTYYYTQNATTTGFDAYTGKVMSTAANATGTYLTMRLATVSKMARWFDWANGLGKPYNFGDWIVAGASWEIQQNVPLLGKICTASVPFSGTQSVIVYESNDDSYGSYHDRFRFDIDPSGKVSITTWQVS